MSGQNDYFKDIDFDKSWDEDDWERFFQAQDNLVRDMEKKSRRRSARPRAGTGLAFRDVLRGFGMDPDGGETEPAPDAWEASGSRREFWEEGAEVESLPIYCEAKCFAYRVLLMFDRHFPDIVTKKYKSRVHQRLQAIVGELQYHAGQTAKNVAGGHGLGYGDAVKGNIVRCKRALSHADVCLGLVTRFPARRLPPEEYRRLFKDTARLRNDLMEWISFLRSRFVTSDR